MRLCLAFMFQNERHWLELHLPVLLSADCFDGIVALDGGSQDGGADYVRTLGASVYHRPFDWDFAAHANALTEYCEQEGYTHVLRVDPDELMHPSELPLLRTYGIVEALAFRRYNFVRDRQHVAWDWYPDWQTRFWKLGRGARYARAVDEVLQGVNMKTHPAMHIYHYGCIVPFNQRYERFINYDRVRNGLPPVENIQAADVEDGYPTGTRFTRPQPLNPLTIGIHAPFGE